MNTPVIIQPNEITNAKYDLSAIQKNIVYEMLHHLKKHMDKEKILSTDLFDNPIVTINIKKLTNDKNYAPVWKAAKDLMGKVFEYKYSRKDKRYICAVTLITSAKHEYGASTVDLKINVDALPILLHIGSGFTTYQKTIAISLKSVYAKRMYELCNRWKDKKGFVMSIKEFRQALMIENKYPLNGNLKSRVLDIAKKELKKNADVWFEYELKKVKSRSYNVISFKVFQQNKIQGQEDKSGVYSKVVGFLSFTFPTAKDGTAIYIADQVLDNGKIDDLERRLQKLFNEYNAGEKEAKDVVRLTKHILRNDYNIKLKRGHFKRLN